jgi:E3 ubiquitin-protein ligase RNF216
MSDESLECNCCYADLDIATVQCIGGHLFCNKCIVYLIQNKISEGSSILEIKCISQDNCTEIIPPTELKSAMGDDLWVKYMEKYEVETIEKVMLDSNSKLEKCSHCSYILEIPQDPNQYPTLLCPKCKNKTCRKCHKEYHDPFTCEQAKNKASKATAEETLSRMLIRTCPNCEKKGIVTPFIKQDGCNRITCPKCKENICYLCEKIIPEKYNHFNDKGCPLWAKDNEEKVISKRKNIAETKVPQKVHVIDDKRLDELRKMPLIQLISICRKKNYNYGQCRWSINKLIDLIAENESESN